MLNYLISPKLNGENSLQSLVKLYVAPRTHYFSSNSKILKIGHRGAISNCGKMSKCVVVINLIPKNDPGIRKEAFKPMWLTQKDLGTWILNDLKWDYNLNYQKRQTLKKVFVILNTFMTRDVVPMTTFWKSICMPTLMYNTSVMGKLRASENKIL